MKDYKNLTKTYNEIRFQNESKAFRTKEMYEILVKIGFAKDSGLLTVLANNHIINRVSHGIYMFPSKPVYYKHIEEVIKRRNNTKIQKKNGENPFLEPAIKICEDCGYIVIKK